MVDWPTQLHSAPPIIYSNRRQGGQALFVSRWSIRRKLSVCLAIVLAIVAALAYSGFSGGYSYKELAWTIRARATDLRRAAELKESVADLRVSLMQLGELEERDFLNEGIAGVQQA